MSVSVECSLEPGLEVQILMKSFFFQEIEAKNMDSLIETLRELCQTLQETTQTFQANISQVMEEDCTSCMEIITQSAIKSTVQALSDISNKYTDSPKVTKLKFGLLFHEMYLSDVNKFQFC